MKQMDPIDIIKDPMDLVDPLFGRVDNKAKAHPILFTRFWFPTQLTEQRDVIYYKMGREVSVLFKWEFHLTSIS